MHLETHSQRMFHIKIRSSGKMLVLRDTLGIISLKIP